jgi:putative transposase
MVRQRGRRSIRLQGYDYTQAGAYFVTICAQGRECLFGEVVDGEMVLNTYGRVVATVWQRIPRHFARVELDEWVVMPNHMHGIIAITGVDGGDATGRGEASPEVGPDGKRASPVEPCLSTTGDSRDASPLQGDSRPAGPASGSLGAIVGNFKSVTTRRINRIRKTSGVRVWQRN